MTMGEGAALHVMYAAFNLLLGALIGTWTLMVGYKGIATNKVRFVRGVQAPAVLSAVAAPVRRPT